MAQIAALALILMQKLKSASGIPENKGIQRVLEDSGPDRTSQNLSILRANSLGSLYLKINHCMVVLASVISRMLDKTKTKHQWVAKLPSET